MLSTIQKSKFSWGAKIGRYIQARLGVRNGHWHILSGLKGPMIKPNRRCKRWGHFHVVNAFMQCQGPHWRNPNARCTVQRPCPLPHIRYNCWSPFHLGQRSLPLSANIVSHWHWPSYPLISLYCDNYDSIRTIQGVGAIRSFCTNGFFLVCWWVHMWWWDDAWRWSWFGLCFRSLLPFILGKGHALLALLCFFFVFPSPFWLCQRIAAFSTVDVYCWALCDHKYRCLPRMITRKARHFITMEEDDLQIQTMKHQTTRTWFPSVKDVQKTLIRIDSIAVVLSNQIQFILQNSPASLISV